MLTHVFTARGVRSAIALVALAAAGYASILVASCSPPWYMRSDEIAVGLRLESSETSEAVHLSFVVRTSNRVLPMAGTGNVSFTVCRADMQPLGSGIGSLRVVADAPSTDAIERTLAGQAPCVSLALDISACDVVRGSTSEARCGVSVEVVRDANPIESPTLVLDGDVRFTVTGDVDAPSDLEDELWVDD